MNAPRAAFSALRCTPLRACVAALLLASLAAGCERDGGDAARKQIPDTRRGSVTVSGDDALAESLTWRRPQVVLAADELDAANRRAREALAAGRLYEDADAAVPLLLAILDIAPDDADAEATLRKARAALLARGAEAARGAGEDAAALRELHRVAAVLRTLDPGAPRVQAFLAQVDLADRLWVVNSEGERELQARRYGAQGGGALARFREALRLQPGQARALQGISAVQSGLIRRAEQAADADDYAGASRWLDLAARVREDDGGALADARKRLQAQRNLRVAALRDAGVRTLPEYNGVRKARDILAELLRIADPGDPAAADLRTRIDLATHYGLFRPGQRFTEALRGGGRGPAMVVVPHGAFRMGAGDDDDAAPDYERPARYVRFDRGFAMSQHEVTVGQFRRYVDATGVRTRAARRGYSMPYDERSNNFVRRSGVDSGSDYVGDRAADDAPVLHVSAADAERYAQWLSAQTGRSYRLPSEAEFEYALRAGTTTRYPWGDAATPPARYGNVTGARDRSPGGRSWSNALPGYGDGYWGPAPVGTFAANAFGLHDMAGNVGEWVADCWHDSYRRAPKDGTAWYNPGCRTRVLRGGSWASSPAQLRSTWRAPVDVDTTNAQIGFRVVRDL